MNSVHRVGAWLLPAAFLTSALFAHGGQYRGPGNVVPPTPGQTGTSGSSGAGPGSGSGAGAGTGSGGAGGSTAPATPTTTSPAPPSSTGGSAAGTTPRGVEVGDDLTRWEFWWEFGKDPYLRLRDVVQARRDVPADDAFLNPRHAAHLRDIDLPKAAHVAAVVDTLGALLGTAKDRDTTSACLIALAKIGRDGTGWRFADKVAPFLRDNDQELRETAALALGIAGVVDDATVDLLTALVRDDAVGRAASGDHAVNERTRAFAAFAMGLLLQRPFGGAHGHRIAQVLCDVVEGADQQGREVLVAAIEALSLYPADRRDDGAEADRAHIVAVLTGFFDRQLGPGAQLVQAHVPPAIARIVTPGSAAARPWFERLCSDLERELDRTGRRPAKSSPFVMQSCVLALGVLAPSWNADDKDAERAGTLLLRVHRDHRDPQTRRFAVQAVGRMGGGIARERLLREFDAASKALEQPWVAMALGALEAAEAARARGRGTSYEAPDVVVERLLDALAEARNPSAQAALALALGLCRATAAGDALRAVLRDKAHDDDLAGYVAIALGLLRDPLAVAPVRDLLQASARRPQVVLHTAQALGLLGDQAVVDGLCKSLDDGDQGLVRLSAIAGALGQIGDRRALAPLLRMAQNPKLTALTRAFAVVALGGVCDKDPLPWNAAFARECNYRAATSTLTDGAAGILDIL